MYDKPIAAVLSSAILLASASTFAQERAEEPRQAKPQQAQKAAPMQKPAPMKGRLSPAQVQQMTRNWPEASRKAIEAMTRKYGAPAAVGGGMAIWSDTGPWKRTVVYNEAVPHDFPMPHVDVLQQWVNYEAPLDRYDEIAKYDGSVVLERTAGKMSARCDKEAANFLAVNLAHEVANGKRTVDEARMEYGRQIKGMMSGEKSDYTSRIMFSPPSAEAARDPDEALAMMKGVKEKQPVKTRQEK